MNIEIDPSAGVCFGVEKAIRKAEKLLSKGISLHGLGYMVHNHSEIERLEQLGMKTLDKNDLDSLSDSAILFRAHGEPPDSFFKAGKNGNTIIDGTCPIVLRLQKKIKEKYSVIDKTREQIVIYGNPEHPEMIGLLGQINDDAIVISTKEELKKIPPGKSIHLYSQTTMDPDGFRMIESALRGSLAGSSAVLSSECTICNQMKKRKPVLAQFAKNYDLMIFVSGKDSSNGRMLYHFCRSINKNSHWISSAEEINPEWFTAVHSVGISGATSTPLWQLENVKHHILSLQ